MKRWAEQRLPTKQIPVQPERYSAKARLLDIPRPASFKGVVTEAAACTQAAAPRFGEAP